MEYLKILELACDEALRIWSIEEKYLRQDPRSTINQVREANAWQQYSEIRALLIDEENKPKR